MKMVLVAVNAKYIHTALAVREIAAFVAAGGVTGTDYAEYTVNQRPQDILEDLYSREADAYLFSCYIWNIALIQSIAADLRALRPGTLIGAGGPQVSYHREAFLKGNPAFDFVLAGEGEAAVAWLAQRLRQGESWRDCPGAALRQGGEILANPAPAPLELDRLPFPYPDLDRCGDRILYYESMRGCPFRCSYCLSSVEQGVRFRSLELVFRDLQHFLAAGARQVKFVDRTFNCDAARARSIWKFLMEQDGGKTNFHFEMAGELLDRESIALLSQARPGLFQFEIGVQSTNPETLKEIRRPADMERLSRWVGELGLAANIHLHLDLITGLPREDYASFARSFDEVYRLEPDQLQVGHLKVLPGSHMEVKAASYDLACSLTPPFSILRNRWLSFGEVVRLRGVAYMVDLYYNSGRFAHIMRWICGRFPGPFACYQALWDLWRREGYAEAPPSKTGFYDILEQLLREQGIPVTQEAKWLCRCDIICHEKPRKVPAWVDVDGTRGHYHSILEFYGDKEKLRCYLPRYLGQEPRQIARSTHLEILPFHPETLQPVPTAVLLDYREGRRLFLEVSERGKGNILYRIGD